MKSKKEEPVDTSTPTEVPKFTLTDKSQTQDLEWLIKYHVYKTEEDNKFVKVDATKTIAKSFQFLEKEGQIEVKYLNTETNIKWVKALHVSDCFNYI